MQIFIKYVKRVSFLSKLIFEKVKSLTHMKLYCAFTENPSHAPPLVSGSRLGRKSEIAGRLRGALTRNVKQVWNVLITCKTRTVQNLTN